MRWVEYEEFESGDKVKLNDEIWEYWYKNIKNFKVKKGEILIKKQMKEQLINNFTWSLREQVSDIVKDFIENDIKDDIKEILVNNKPIILKNIQDSLIKISAEISKKLIEEVTKNIKNSYHMKKIIEGLFG